METIISPAWEGYSLSKAHICGLLPEALLQHCGNVPTRKATCIWFKSHKSDFPYKHTLCTLFKPTYIHWHRTEIINLIVERSLSSKRKEDFVFSANTKPQSHACQYLHLRKKHQIMQGILLFHLPMRYIHNVLPNLIIIMNGKFKKS